MGSLIRKITTIIVTLSAIIAFGLAAHLYLRGIENGTMETPIKMLNHFSVENRINTETGQLLASINADRILVYQFFDPEGTRPSEKNLALSKAINEVTGPGVSKERAARQRLIRSLYPSWYKQMGQGQCVLIDQEKETSIYYIYLKEAGVKSAIKCPIRNASREFVGSISVEFTKTSVDTVKLAEFEPQVLLVADKIGAMLEETAPNMWIGQETAPRTWIDPLD